MFETKEALVSVVSGMADSALRTYGDTKEWTSVDGMSCMTIRVPVSLLKRIKDMNKMFEEE